MSISDPDEPRPRRSLLRFTFWATLAVLAVAFMFLFAIGARIDSKQIDPQAVAPPPELAKVLAQTPESPKSDPAATESYRQFVVREKKEKLLDQVRAVFPDTQLVNPNDNRKYSRPWSGGPLTESQTKWVRDHAELIDAILKFVNTPGYAAEIPDEIVKSTDPQGQAMTTSRRLELARFMMQLLTADGWLKLHDGNPDGVKSYLAIYRIPEKFWANDETGSTFKSMFFPSANARIKEWIEDPVSPKQTAAAIELLNKIYDAELSPTHRIEDFEIIYQREYQWYRDNLIQSLNKHSWKSDYFGYNIGSHPDFYWAQLGHSDVYLPLVHRMLQNTATAMYNKQNAEQYVFAFDEAWVDARTWPTRPWRQVMPMTWMAPGLDKHYTGSLDSMYVMQLTAETFFNLNRAALAYMLDPKSAEAARKIDFSNNLNHPWRDPFTDAAFCVSETTSQTLIYSLGPALKDHKGLVEYKATQGIGGDGNLVIHLPRKK